MRGDGLIDESSGAKGEKADWWLIFHFALVLVAHVTDMNLVAIAIGAVIIGNILGRDPKAKPVRPKKPIIRKKPPAEMRIDVLDANGIYIVDGPRGRHLVFDLPDSSIPKKSC